MRRGLLCLLLLAGCGPPEGPRTSAEYAVTWTCRSPEGCEHTEELMRFDRMEIVYKGRTVYFTSTEDPAFTAQGTQILSDLLPRGCSWLYFLTLFGHELERSQLCFEPGAFDLELSIPNEDPTTYSVWRVRGQDLDLL